MTAARDRLAIAELTSTLTGEFDLPAVLDTVAHDACTGFNAASVAVVLRDDQHQIDDTGLQVVAEALCGTTEVDLGFVSTGPAAVSARAGAVTMISDIAEADDSRWPDYRRAALRAGMRGMRGFPVTILGSPAGALVVHTEDPWGLARPNDFGQVMANLAAIAISIAPQVRQRRGNTGNTIDALLKGTVAIATATGIIAQVFGIAPQEARLRLHRLARAHGRTLTVHAEHIVAAHDRAPQQISRSNLLAQPAEAAPPPHIDT